MKSFLIVVAAVAAGLAALAWLGLRIQPASFPAYPEQSPQMESLPLPAGLPAPVERFYRGMYGDQIPVIHSVIMTGRVTLKPFGDVAFPGRFRFTHDAGKGYRHYIEAAFFGLPVMKVNERYIDGESLMELPFGVTAKGPKVEQAANLGMWAELAWTPAVFLTDARVRWEALDDASAVLVVPFEDGEERFVVRFDSESGMLRHMEVMRYRDEKDPERSLWITDALEYGTLDGIPVMKKGSATWFQDGKPWAVFTLEELRFNVDVNQYLRARGL